MVVSNFAKNLGNTVKTRPPLVVFTICLLGITVTTLCLAYYIHTKDKILNTDVKQEWLSLLKHFNTMSVCLEDNNDPTSVQAVKTSSATIASKATLDIDTLKHPINVQGRIPLKGWSSNCPDETDLPEYLHISFGVPNPNNTKELCVTLTGPSNFIPKLLDDYKICEPVVKQGAKWETLTAVIDSEEGFCKDGLSGKLLYNIDAYKSVKVDAFLSMEDRLTINYHLMIITSVLLIIIVCITIFAFCGKKSSTNGGDATQYLMARSI